MWDVDECRNGLQADAAHGETEALFSLSLEMLCIAGTDGYFRRVNPALENTLGYSNEELLARPFVDFVHPDDRLKTLQETMRLAEGHVTVRFENRYIARDGSVRWFSWMAVPHPDGRVFASARDITEQKLAQQQLVASEVRYRRLLEAVTTYTYTVEFVGGLPKGTCHSEGCVAATGYQPADFQKDPYLWILMVLPEDRPLVLNAVSKIHQGQDVPPLEHRIVHRDGTVRWIRTTIVLHRDADGNLSHYDGVVEDITERRWAEDRFRRLLESAPDAMVIVDREGVIALINAQAERLLGYPRAELVGQSVETLVPVDVRASHRELREQYAQSPGSCAMGSRPALAARRKDGTVFPAEISLGPIETREGLMISCAIRDLTERNRIEKILREQHAQLLAAEQIQQHLLPRSAPDLPGYDVAGSMHPADFAAGDAFDYLRMPDGSLGIVVADVAGHGFSSALLMASTHAYLRSLAATILDPGELLTRINGLLVNEIESGRFVTMFLGRLVPASRSLTYVNAGHPAGFVLDSSGAVRATLSSTSMPLGIKADAVYRTGSSVLLERGDLLFLITDGMSEAQSASGEPLGIETIVNVVREHRHASAREILQAQYEAVEAHCRPLKHLDDVTSVVIKIL